ncbi:MAG: hypothetical protein HQM08_09355 [Candidatus Riflebacteria bacterium]|nr:hypothetical protein [Candidatus Riflebacteria bacterium]
MEELKEKKEFLEKKVDRLIREHQEKDKDSSSSDSTDSPENFRKHQIERLNRQAERIKKFLDEANLELANRKLN